MTAATLALPARYRGAELIATGGMADVYVATDETLDRVVAIKVLSERFAHDPELRERFTREARIAARLSVEPNVVTIFDVADVAGRPAIMMEFLPGGTLAERMQSARIPPALALAWLEQAARALDAAHAAGVVHRDVKPANLMLGPDGEVRVTDFGIARIAGDVSLTSVGTILGTSGYMSPEQAVGGTATAASDRYGLAVVAFELLSRAQAVPGRDLCRGGRGARDGPDTRGELVRRLAATVPRCGLARGLAKDPAARYASCGELVATLRSCFAESAATTMRMTRAVPSTREIARAGTATRSRGPLRVLALAAALGVVGLIGVALAGRVGGGAEEAARPTTVVRTTTVAGASQVRTVTVEAQPAPPPTTAANPQVSAPTGTNGATLNDEGYRLLRSGDAAAAAPILERAVSALQGSGSLAEAYASYNLALARFSTGDCTGVGAAPSFRADPGEAVGDQAARARPRQELQELTRGTCPTGFRPARPVSGGVAVRAPQLQLALRSFTLGAFAFLLRELDDGAELPVAFVEHEHAGGPALYEYRPLVRAFVEERGPGFAGERTR